MSCKADTFVFKAVCAAVIKAVILVVIDACAATAAKVWNQVDWNHNIERVNCLINNLFQ